MAKANSKLYTTRNAGRLMLVMLGSALLLTSMLTPWWTRGVTIDYSDENPRSIGESGLEGGYVHYGPFRTPGSLAGFSTDGLRETATAVLGLSMLLVIGFVGAYLVLRAMHSSGRIELSPNVPVRLAMAATLLGVFAVVWAALFLPLLGPNPGWMWGEEAAGGEDFGEFIESGRFANVGWYAGLLGGVVYPAILWASAHNTRALSEVSGTTRTGTAA